MFFRSFFRSGTLFVALGPLVAAQAPDLTYQPRGTYSEGKRTKPSTDARVDLVAALINYSERAASAVPVPESYRAEFYMPEPGMVYLILREADKLRYFYWLQQDPFGAWQPGHAARFEWSTAKVIRYLNGSERHQLVLDDLGAVARMGKAEADLSERVLPVALYVNQPLQQADAYAFAFRPNGPVRLTFDVFPEKGGAAAGPHQEFPSAVAGKAQWVRFDAAKWPDG